MSRKIVLNTVAYQEVLKENPRQAELIPEIKLTGIDYVEIHAQLNILAAAELSSNKKFKMIKK